MITDIRSFVASKGGNPDTIFVTGNTDVIASRVIPKLLEVGHSNVRLGIRDIDESSRKAFQLGAQLVNFQWEDESTYALALKGVDTVFCAMPHHEGCSLHFPAFFAACRAANVKHFVKLSFYHALTATRAHIMAGFHVALPDDNKFAHVPLIQMHGDCDEMIIKGRSMGYTILFCTHYMSDPLVYHSGTIKKQGLLYGSSHGQKVNYVSPNDVAEVALRVLIDPTSHKRVGYNLVGPNPLKDEDVAILFSKAVQKTIEYKDLKDKDLEEEEKLEGEPSWLISDLVALEQLKSSGIEEEFTSNDIQRICGHPAEPFDAYLAAKSMMTVPEQEAF